MWQEQLITLYCTVCQAYDNGICVKVQRLSNNNRPKFSDQELMTVYLWGTIQGLRSVKAIYTYTIMHLPDWYPTLPSFQSFDRRFGELCMAFAALAECLVDCGQEDALTLNHLIVDSMPISLAKLCRADRAKVAPEPCAKTYNPSRKEWYYGLKLHAFIPPTPSRVSTAVIAA